MTTTTMNTNGQSNVRKTLASQIDRLDRILDGLSDALNGAVASAVQEAVVQTMQASVEVTVRQAVEQAVKEAVQAVLMEVLTNVDLRTALAGAAPADAPPEPDAPPPSRSRQMMSHACDWARDKVEQAKGGCTRLLGRALLVKPLVQAGWELVRRSGRRLLVASGVGIVAGAAAYYAGPWLGVAAAWVGGFTTTLAVQARDSVRRMLTVAFATD